MRHERMIDSRLSANDLAVRPEKFLQILITRLKRIGVALSYAAFQQMQNNLSVFRIILVPRVK